jgi:quinolinate synthase
MADMAEIDQVEDCWEQLAEVIDVEDVMPVTYVNSAAALKAFCGRHGGIVCTSANAGRSIGLARGRVLFFPDQPGPNTRWRWDPLAQMPFGTAAEVGDGAGERRAAA